MARWFAAFSLLLLADDAGFAQGVRPNRTERVPMRDGTRLATDIYLPAPDAKRLPTILVQTPYGRGNYNNEWGSRAAGWDYAVVIQDMRGRGASEGRPRAFMDSGWGEHRDGYDTVEWIARQPFSNGKIGTVGASAMGIAQNMVAPAAPEHLTCQYILVAAASLYHHGAYHGGVFRKCLAEGWLLDNQYPQANLEEVRDHPLYDEMWKLGDAVREAHRINVPAIHYGGWFDIFSQGTIDAFVSRQQRGAPGARGTQKLVIGPWLHGGPGAVDIGDFQLPENARSIPIDVGAKRWFDFYLKGQENGADKIPPVLYYVMGPFDQTGPGNKWRTADTWPPAATPTSLYLHKGGGLSRRAPTDKGARASFVFDPADPAPTIGGPNMRIEGGPKDQRPLEKRDDVLVFSTDVLEEPIEATGRLTTELWIASDRRDTDFAVRLCDVYPDGRSILIADGIQRCAVRDSLEKGVPLEPNEPTRIRVDLWSTSIVFAKGHRIRILLSSSNYPRFEVNPNTAFSDASPGTVWKATNTILFEADHPSRLILPVVGN
jgi:predicted acyl esterase